MSNFSALSNYHIKPDLLVAMLDLYKILGLSDVLENKLQTKKAALEKMSIEKDAYLLVSFLKIDLTDTRKRLLITKDAEPRTQKEKMVKTVINVLKSIRQSALENDPINSSDILDFLKSLFGKDLRFSGDDFRIHGDKKKSTRYVFNQVMDEYEICYQRQSFERISLSCIAVMELYNIKPYSQYNDLAFILLYYYLLLRSGATCFYYDSFFELYFQNSLEINSKILEGSISYDQGTLYFTEFVKKTFELIKTSFRNLEEYTKTIQIEQHAHKSDYIEKSIIEDIPPLFSKEDIKKLYPEVSDSTIMRALTKLNAKKYIMPLSKGRSAKWKRLIDKNDPKYLFGDSENEN